MLNFEKYKLEEAQLKTFDETFFELLPNVDLNHLSPEDFNENINKYYFGIYFWVLVIGNQKYKIYIGKTNSIKRRVTEYSIDFQIHSPNDFKMRFFQNFIARNFNHHSLSLFFSPQTKENYTKTETKEIKFYQPMINEHSKTASLQKKVIQDAYEHYYKSIFTSKLI